MGDDNEKTFVVKDKRRFNSEGEEQSSSEKVADTNPQANNVNSSSSVKKEDKISADSEAITFPSFLMSLAMQALMQLGEIPAPQGTNIPKDKIAAKQTIDVIAMLKDKTKGNLDKDEDKMIEEVLHNLRISFLRA
jgi:hypothetical protein